MKLEAMRKLLDTRSEEMLKKMHNECSIFSGTRMTPLTWNEIRFISIAAKNWDKIISVIDAFKQLEQNYELFYVTRLQGQVHFNGKLSPATEEITDLLYDLREALKELEKE